MALAKQEFLDADAMEDAPALPAASGKIPLIQFKHPQLIDHAELEAILPNLSRISKWIDDVFSFAADEAINHGASWRGYKVVEGRSVRKFADEKAVIKAATDAGYTDIYKKSLITLTEFEKLMGKKVFQSTLGSYVIKPPGKLALAPESDKRQAVDLSGGVADFQALPDTTDASNGEEE